MKSSSSGSTSGRNQSPLPDWVSYPDSWYAQRAAAHKARAWRCSQEALPFVCRALEDRKADPVPGELFKFPFDIKFPFGTVDRGHAASRRRPSSGVRPTLGAAESVGVIDVLINRLGSDNTLKVLEHLSAYDTSILFRVCRSDNKAIHALIRDHSPLGLKMRQDFFNIAPIDLSAYVPAVRHAVTTTLQKSPRDELDALVATQESLLFVKPAEIDILPAPRSKVLGLEQGFLVLSHSPPGVTSSSQGERDFLMETISIIQVARPGPIGESPFGPQAKIVDGKWTWRWMLSRPIPLFNAASRVAISMEKNVLAFVRQHTSNFTVSFLSLLPEKRGGFWPEYDSTPPFHPSARESVLPLVQDTVWQGQPPSITIKLGANWVIGVLVTIRISGPGRRQATLFHENFNWKTGHSMGGLAPLPEIRILDFAYLGEDKVMVFIHSLQTPETRLEVWKFRASGSPKGMGMCIFPGIGGTLPHKISLVPLVRFELEFGLPAGFQGDGLLELQRLRHSETVGIFGLRAVNAPGHQMIRGASFKLSFVDFWTTVINDAHLHNPKPANAYFRPANGFTQDSLSSARRWADSIWPLVFGWPVFKYYVSWYGTSHIGRPCPNGTWALHLEPSPGPESVPILKVLSYNSAFTQLFQEAGANATNRRGGLVPPFRVFNKGITGPRNQTDEVPRLPDWVGASLPNAKHRDYGNRVGYSDRDDPNLTDDPGWPLPLSFIGGEMRLPVDPIGTRSTILKFDGRQVVIAREPTNGNHNSGAGSILVLTFGADTSGVKPTKAAVDADDDPAAQEEVPNESAEDDSDDDTVRAPSPM
ncbi:hypothetical protein Q8F55_002572 [Vanrija albida]|uniref:Uncharacterized protein n=1 Tax=Vanrija albida TaxID=181172 RepID=A0ABR3QA63_9TREE